MANLASIVSLILSLTKYVNVGVLVALSKVLLPFPSFSDIGAVTLWLNGLSIGGPLRDAILAEIPATPPPAPAKACSLDDVMEEINKQLAADVDGTHDHVKALPPGTLLKIAEFILGLLTTFGV